MKYTQTGTTLCFPACVCAFSLFFHFPGKFCELKQSYWVHTAVSLVCSSVFISLSISQIASRGPTQLCFFALRISTISKQTDVSIPARGAGSDVRRVCLHVEVSTLIQTSLFPLICLLQMLHWVSKRISAPGRKEKKKKKKAKSNTFLCL